MTTPETAAILEGLNPAQEAAVTHGEGPLLILAGAGTGKTAVLTRRIAYLIATKRARPEEILALTFTEKAAAEMEARVDLLTPYGTVEAWIGTFHAAPGYQQCGTCAYLEPGSGLGVIHSRVGGAGK